MWFPKFPCCRYLLTLLVSLVLCGSLAVPAAVMAKVHRMDALEGDPTDGLDASGGGGGSDSPVGDGDQGSSTGTGDRFLPFEPVVVPGYPTPVLVPIFLNGEVVHLVLNLDPTGAIEGVGR
jgi:hypothetical protein